MNTSVTQNITQNITELVNIIHDDSMKHIDGIIDDDMQFESEEVAYNSYNEYARRMGFGIRREWRNLSKKDGVLTSRLFVCHKEGDRGEDKRDHLTKEERAETRTGCPAHMLIYFKRKIGKYKIRDFVAEHNHPLQPPDYVHMIRSQRHITEAQAVEIETANDCGLSLRDFNEFMARKAGGIDNLGFTKVDQKNYLRTKTKYTFKFGELNALLMYFKEQAKKDPLFFYDFQLDKDDQITNIFWADAGMINDYIYFGDVSAFDTTFRTNKDYRPLGIFVGYNNHRQTVIFGAALLYDETTASFEWMFETFLKAMGGKKPKTILTDQDAAMAKAIPRVMPETFHGLCTWHIRQNALRHVNHLYHNNSDFSQSFEACIDVYEKEDEFLEAWDALLVQHDVPGESWLHTIFKVKEKWAWAYVIKTLNSSLKSHLKSDLNLVDFFIHFERVVNSKHYNESIAEHDSIHKLPRLKMKKAPMLVQAGNIYTPKIFEEFQEDYEEYLGAYIKDDREDQSMHVYTVANVNETKDRIVASNFLEQTVYCNCRKFETHGILCSHALKVLDIMNIKLIPDHYILKRWTRDARRGRKDDWIGKHKEVDNKAHFTNRYRELCPRIGNLVNRACESPETYSFMSKICEESTKIVEQILAGRSCLSEEATKTCNISISMTSEDLERNEDIINYNGAKGINKKECLYKGRSRPKSWLEKSNRKVNASLKQRQKKTLGTEPNKNCKTKSTEKSITNTKRMQKQSQEILPMIVEQLASQQASLQQLRSPTTSSTDHCMLDSNENLTFTQLLTESFDNNPKILSPLMNSQCEKLDYKL